MKIEEQNWWEQRRERERENEYECKNEQISEWVSKEEDSLRSHLQMVSSVFSLYFLAGLDYGFVLLFMKGISGVILVL
jgi:hypothetical protein